MDVSHKTLCCKECGTESTESDSADGYCRSCFYEQTWGHRREHRSPMLNPGTGAFKSLNPWGGSSGHRRTFRAGMWGSNT